MLTQTLSVLKSVASAVVWALDQALSFILNEVEQLITVAISPVWAGFKHVIASFLPAMESASNATINWLDRIGTLNAAIAANELAIAPVTVFAIVMEAVMCIALGITIPLSVGAGLVLGLLVSVILSVVGSGSLTDQGRGSQNQLFTFISNSLSASVRAMVSAGESAANYTLQHILESSLTTGGIQPIPDPPDCYGAVGIASSSIGFVGGTIGLGKGQPAKSAVAGFYLSAISWGLSAIPFTFELTQPNGCNDQPILLVNSILGEDVSGTILSFPAMALDFLGLSGPAGPTRTLAAVGAGMDVIGLVTGLVGIEQDLGCQSTAY